MLKKQRARATGKRRGFFLLVAASSWRSVATVGVFSSQRRHRCRSAPREGEELLSGFFRGFFGFATATAGA